MQVTRFSIDPGFPVAPVDPRLFGSFVEHMGRCVYTGVFEPGHPAADADGFRADVLDLVRELGPTIVRYPGGNFVSGYRWEDGVGPLEQRPRRLDLAWRTVESNHFGIDEFLRWCGAAGVEPMVAVNLGTRGVAEATDLLEYCNHPAGTALSDLRRSNGTEKPHAVKVWCLGNELDGPWQVGHKTAREYGRLAAETARAMRMVDANVELVAVGSSNSSMPTFGAWEDTVLEECYDLVDYVSLHNYYEPLDDDVDSFLASGVDLDRAIQAIAATADAVGARLRSSKQIKLSVDEWNVWHHRHFSGQHALDWADRRELIEDRYDVTDAVVVGSLLISLLRNADRVAIACQAQLVNVIAPVMTRPDGPAWRQTVFHPFAQAARHARGTVLRVEPRGPVVDTARFGPVPVVDATATVDPKTGDLTVLAVNRSRTETVQMDADVRSMPGLRLAAATTLTSDDPTTRNTEEQPDAVTPQPLREVSLAEGRLLAALPPVSWNVLRLRVADPTTHRKEHDR